MPVSFPQAICLTLVLIAFLFQLASWMAKKQRRDPAEAPICQGAWASSNLEAPGSVARIAPPPEETQIAIVSMDWDRFFQAIAWMETRGEADPDATHLEHSTARGRYGITLDFWLDANMQYGTHENCHEEAYARVTCLKYYQRHCRKAFRLRDWHVLARVHRKGPSGKDSETAHQYADAVLALMRGGLNSHK